MKPNADDDTRIARALSDLVLDASDDQLRDALADTNVEFDDLAARGRAAVERALANTPDESGAIEDLHRGLGALIHLLRRRNNLSVEQLAAHALIDDSEIRGIEHDPRFDPNPRTIYQLEQYFGLPPRCLVILSGAIHVESNVRQEAVRFAADSSGISELSRDEKRLLNRFVKFLGEYTDR